MKKKFFLFAVLPAFLLQACKEDRYIDLNTGKTVSLEKDEKTGLLVNTETGKPVEIYVDTKTNDTIYGRSGKVINGRVVKRDGAKWVYNDDDTKIKNEAVDYKKEVEKDGDIKIKQGDKKTKIDGETGEKKVKNDD